MNLNIKNTFISELPMDSNTENYPRQVDNACYSIVAPTKTKKPRLIHSNTQMAEQLGFSKSDLKSESFLNICTGNAIYPNTTPYAMCYGGHQFGNWAGQ